MPDQRLSVDEKKAMLIKAYELEPLPKLSLLIGERAVKQLLHSGQYLGSLLQPKNLFWITGQDKTIKLLDEDTARMIRDHPVTGYSHYLTDHGAANVFGRQVFEGNMPLEPAIGAASAIGVVEDTPDGKTRVLKKTQMGIEPKTIRQVADKFHRVEPETPQLLQKKERPKEMYEEIHDQALQRKEEDAAHDTIIEEDDVAPLFLLEDDQDLEIQDAQETPPLVGDEEVAAYTENPEERLLIPETQLHRPRRGKREDEEDEESSLPF